MAIEIREYDDATRIVIIRNGMETTQRPYTAEENAEADSKVLLHTNEQTLNTDAKLAITTLQTSITSLKTIVDKLNADIGPADTKTLARELTTVARQLLRLSRLSVKAFDTATV